MVTENIVEKVVCHTHLMNLYLRIVVDLLYYNNLSNHLATGYKYISKKNGWFF